MYILIILFIFFAFLIFWAMIGYPLSLKIIGKYYKKPNLVKNEYYEPSVTLMIVAHNEEKVILEKLGNVVKLDYPKNKIEILISSDNSDDKTNDIITEFIECNKAHNIRLYKVKERKGKTNAQNEAAATVKNEILIMTDANAMLDSESVKEIVSSFSTNNIAYVTGRLKYVNSSEEWTSASESSYWEFDLKMRQIESNLHSVTAGNGALYACRTKEYYNFDPIKSHDSSMPIYYVLLGKRAIYNENAIAYERAGEKVEDEFGRKVRMSRSILSSIFPDIRLFNIFQYNWFCYCYFGHRYCRNNLWLAHSMLFLINIPLVFYADFFKFIFLFQVSFYLIAAIRHFTNIDNKALNMVYYYAVTIIAQVIGAYRQATGKSKPFWEKAESTR